MRREYSLVTIIMSIITAVFIITTTIFTFLPLVKVKIDEENYVSISCIDCMSHMGDSAEDIKKSITEAKENEKIDLANKLLAVSKLKENKGLFLAINSLLIITWSLAVISLILTLLSPYFPVVYIINIVTMSLLMATTIALFIVCYNSISHIQNTNLFTITNMITMILSIFGLGTTIGLSLSKIFD